MTAVPAVQDVAAATDPAARAPRRRVLASAGLMLGSATSAQVGAALGAHAFGAIGPAGVVAVRQIVAVALLVPTARPPFRQMTWAQWWPTLMLASVFACMNLSLYTAVDRIGLGLAVTLEFLGPLALALWGSHGRRDLVIAIVAAAGVYVLVLPGPTSDWIGVGLALFAAGLWVMYILLNRLVGGRLPGLQAPAAATTVSAVIYLPVLITLIVQGRFTGMSLIYAASAGVLSSAVPYAGDLVALRRVSPRFFGVFMSVHPAMAALAGLVLLGQVLRLHEWVGIAIVVLANAVAVAISPARDHRT